jgi:hypothetical protein
MDEVDRAIADGDTARAEAFLGALTDPQNGEYKIKVNGSEIFGTKANLIRLEGLEDKLEQAEVKGYETSIKTAKIALADASLDVQQALGMTDDEQNLLDVITTWEDEVRNNRSVTINGKTYDDPLVVSEISGYLSGAKNNTRLFRKNLRSQFISQHTGRDLNLLTQGIYSPDAIKQFSGDIYTKFVTTDPLTMKPSGFTVEGQDFQFEVNAQKDILQNNLYDSLLHLPVAERPLAYRTQYQAEVANPLRDFVNTKLEAYQKVEEQKAPSDKIYFTKEEELSLSEAGFLPHEVEEIKTETIATRKAIGEAEVFQSTGDGGRELKGASGIYYDMALIPSYLKALDDGLFEDANEQIKGFDAVRKQMTTKQRNGTIPSNMENLYSLYSRKPFFRDLTITERLNRKRQMREKFSQFGISAAELGRDTLNFKKQILVSEIYGGIPMFSDFPIVINNSVDATVSLVSEYKETGQVKASSLDEIAEQYGIPVEAILNAQYQYFKSNNFIRN